MIRAMFGGHALFTISDRTFEKMVKANDGMTGFHIHVAEGVNDVYDSLRTTAAAPSTGCCITASWARRPCWGTASM